MSAKRITRTALMAVLTLLAGFIRIQLGPIPLTMQTLAVNLTALILPPLDALMAMLVHLLLKFLIAGPEPFTLPSAGFLYGFVLAAWVGSLYLKSKTRTEPNTPTRLTALILAATIPYLVGLPYMTYHLNVVMGMNNGLAEILQLGVIPFIPGDILKIILADLIGQRLIRQIRYEQNAPWEK